MIGKAQRSMYQKRRKIVAAIHGIFPLGPAKHLTEFPLLPAKIFHCESDIV
jgi:hypothetical protein